MSQHQHHPPPAGGHYYQPQPAYYNGQQPPRSTYNREHYGSSGDIPRNNYSSGEGEFYGANDPRSNRGPASHGLASYGPASHGPASHGHGPANSGTTYSPQNDHYSQQQHSTQQHHAAAEPQSRYTFPQAAQGNLTSDRAAQGRYTSPQSVQGGATETRSPLTSFAEVHESHQSASPHLESWKNPSPRISPPPPHRNSNLQHTNQSRMLGQSMHGNSFIEVKNSHGSRVDHHSRSSQDPPPSNQDDGGRYLNHTASLKVEEDNALLKSLPAYKYNSVDLLKESELGRGSYGSVCKARLDGLLICAAKRIHPLVHQNFSKARQGFIDECKILSSLRHPNVVQYLGTFDIEGALVLLMELMDESLTKYLKGSKSPIPYHTQISICHDIALALAFLHFHGIIHRDLSSNNILLAGDKRAKVTDFGVATKKRRTEMEKHTAKPGTPVYMPRETIGGEGEDDNPEYDQQIDCFSLGVLGIQILTRQYPAPTNLIVKNSLVPELERRKNDIGLVKDQNHPILTKAKECLADEHRPSAEHLSRYFEDLKSKESYIRSKKMEANSDSAGAANGQSPRSMSEGTEEVSRLCRENERLERELNMLRPNYERLSRDRQRLKEQSGMLEHEAANAHGLRNDLSAQQDENRRLNQQVADLTKRYRQQSMRIEHETANARGLRDDLSAQRDENRRLNDELQALRREGIGNSPELKRELDQLKLQQIPELKQSITAKNQEIAAARKKLDKRELELMEIIEARNEEIKFFNKKLGQTKRCDQRDFTSDAKSGNETKDLQAKIDRLEKQLDSKGVSASLNAEELQFQLKKEREERKRTQEVLDEMLNKPDSIKLSSSLPSYYTQKSQQQRQRAWSMVSKKHTLQPKATFQKCCSLNLEPVSNHHGSSCAGEGVMSIRAQLKSVAEKDKCVEATVTSSYEVSYTPESRGRHILTVTVNDDETSSHEVFVEHPIENISSPYRTINEIPGALRVAVFTSNNMLYASDSPNRKYHIFDLSSNTVLESIACKIDIRGIAVDVVGNVYLTSSHWLYKYSGSGDRVGAIGSDRPGNGDTSFNNPTGVQVHDGQIYVCDTDNGRILVFNRDLSFTTKFGHGMSGIGKIIKKSSQLLKPEDIAFDTGVKTFVLDSEKRAVVVFERMVYSQAISMSQLLKPAGLCYRDGHLLVTDWAGRSFGIFKVNGEFVRKVDFSGSPVGICTDIDGYIYIANSIDSRVVVY